MAQVTVAARSITQSIFKTGIKSLRASVEANALHKLKWLHLINWKLAEESWATFGELIDSLHYDKDGLKLWTKHFVSKDVCFRLPTSEFAVHLLLISLTKVESSRGRRKGKPKRAKVQKTPKAETPKKPIMVIKRTSDAFFFSAAEEDYRLVKVMWNLRQYYHIHVDDSQVGGMTTIRHANFGDVLDWRNTAQVLKFLRKVRPIQQASSNKNSCAYENNPEDISTEGLSQDAMQIQHEQSIFSESEPNSSDHSAEASFHEISLEPLSHELKQLEQTTMAVYADFGADNDHFINQFLTTPPCAYSFAEVVQRSVNVIARMFSTAPERVDGFVAYLDSMNPPVENLTEHSNMNFV